jgi:LexA DNA binding domain-containing protein
VRPLSKRDRKALLLILLSQSKRGHSPTWKELRTWLGLPPKVRTFHYLEPLSKRGFLTWTDDVPRSPRVTVAGKLAALAKDGE